MAEVVLNLIVEGFLWLFDWGDGRDRRRADRQLRKTGTSHE